MPHYYLERRQVRLNHFGVERGDHTNAEYLLSQKARPVGMDGDGTAKNSENRLWESDNPIPVDHFVGVTEIAEALFTQLIDIRESTKPSHTQPDQIEPPITPDEIAQLRALIPGR